MRFVTIFAAAALVTGCSADPGDQPAPANQAAAPKPEKPPHCFFKDAETKDWSAKVQGGNILVAGRAFRSDPRYKAVALEPKVEGAVAVVRPSISINDTGFASPDNWWDVTASIPAEGVGKVEVRCGKKVIASLDLPKKAG